MSLPTIALLALALGCGCGKSSNPTSPAPSVGSGSGSGAAPSEKAAKMTEQKLDGAWRSSVAPDYPLRLTATGTSYTVAWEPTIDSDNAIAGSLASQGANTWRGTVYLRAGDENRDVPMTLRFDPATQTLHMELPAMFSDPIAFQRGDQADKATKAAADDCAAQAVDVLAATAAYKKLEAGARHLQTMTDGETSHDRVCDLRVFVDGEGGETQTVGRFRVDFKARQVLQYNPAEDSYTPLAAPAELFKPRAP
jgi:hypothetical protein